MTVTTVDKPASRLRYPVVLVLALATLLMAFVAPRAGADPSGQPVSTTGDISATAGPSWPTLRQGSRGPNVRTMQLLLQQRGYYIGADGQFGPNTKKAVNTFKRRNGLRVDGIVGPKFWGKVTPRLTKGMHGKKVSAAKVQLNKHGTTFNVHNHHFGQKMSDVVLWIKASIGWLNDNRVINDRTWRYLLGTNPARGNHLPIPKNSVDRGHFGRPHHTYPAIDLMVNRVPAYAAKRGTIAHFSSATCGKGIQLRLSGHNRINYCHMDRRLVADGATVNAGTRIGITGETGNAAGKPHLHFEIRTDTSSGVLRCPQPWLLAVYDGRKPPALTSLPTSGCVA